MGAPTGPATLISDMWTGLPDNIDAAFSRTDGKVFFFKGSEYWRYDGRKDYVDYPKRISSDFPGIPDNLDGAMYYPPSGDTYFFKGNLLFGGNKNCKLQMISILNDDFSPQTTNTGYTMPMKYQKWTLDIRYLFGLLMEYPTIWTTPFTPTVQFTSSREDSTIKSTRNFQRYSPVCRTLVTMSGFSLHVKFLLQADLDQTPYPRNAFGCRTKKNNSRNTYNWSPSDWGKALGAVSKWECTVHLVRTRGLIY